MMPFDYFLRIDSITPGPPDPRHRNEVPLEAYSLEVRSKPDPGEPPGETRHSLSIVKKVDQFSGPLAQLLVSQTTVTRATLFVTSVGALAQDHAEYRFEGAQVSRITEGGNTTGEDSVKETLRIEFARLAITTRSFGADGTVNRTVTVTLTQLP